jgi:hypothetical protein
MGYSDHYMRSVCGLIGCMWAARCVSTLASNWHTPSSPVTQLSVRGRRRAPHHPLFEDGQVADAASPIVSVPRHLPRVTHHSNAQKRRKELEAQRMEGQPLLHYASFAALTRRHSVWEKEQKRASAVERQGQRRQHRVQHQQTRQADSIIIFDVVIARTHR